MGKYTKEDIIRMVREDDIEFIRMQFTDIFGQLKNVAITSSQIEKAVNNQIMIDGSSIEGFVRMNTAGAGIYDVRHAYTMLWILTGVYFVTTCLVYRYQIWKDKKRGFSGVLDSGID